MMLHFPVSQTDIYSPKDSFTTFSLKFISGLISHKIKKIILLTGITLIIASGSVNGQVLKDSSSVKLIKKGIDYIYNFKFDYADRVKLEIKKLYPGHPINYLFEGMIAYWKYYPLTTTSQGRESFEANMRKCIELCDKNKNSSVEAETLLLNLCARGLLLLFYTENDLSFEVFPIASSTYQCVRKSFGFTATYLDLYFFTGIYNYYREAYPEAHPLYRALAFLFPKGDKTKGLADLQIVAKKSILMRAESYTFLNDIFSDFENDFEKATSYSKNLHSIYPNNPQYLGTYIKNLLIIKQYDLAEKEIQTSKSIENPFFKAQVTVFNGVIQEKKYKNLKMAIEYYSKGIRDISAFRNLGNEYAAYAYFGLSRISAIDGDDNNKKAYRKLAVKLADFKKINFDE